MATGVNTGGTPLLLGNLDATPSVVAGAGGAGGRLSVDNSSGAVAVEATSFLINGVPYFPTSSSSEVFPFTLVLSGGLATPLNVPALLVKTGTKVVLQIDPFQGTASGGLAVSSADFGGGGIPIRFQPLLEFTAPVAVFNGTGNYSAGRIYITGALAISFTPTMGGSGFTNGLSCGSSSRLSVSYSAPS